MMPVIILRGLNETVQGSESQTYIRIQEETCDNLEAGKDTARLRLESGENEEKKPGVIRAKSSGWRRDVLKFLMQGGGTDVVAVGPRGCAPLN